MDHAFVAALTRRASLLTLGSAGLAALAQPMVSSAKKKKKKQKKGDVNQFCKKQVDQCRTFLSASCEGEGQAACLLAVETCCPEFGTCNFAGFFDCIAQFQS